VLNISREARNGKMIATTCTIPNLSVVNLNEPLETSLPAINTNNNAYKAQNTSEMHLNMHIKEQPLKDPQSRVVGGMNPLRIKYMVRHSLYIAAQIKSLLQ